MTFLLSNYDLSLYIYAFISLFIYVCICLFSVNCVFIYLFIFVTFDDKVVSLAQQNESPLAESATPGEYFVSADLAFAHFR